MPATPPQAGLRARKKERTRHELRDSAARLFAARGFAGTTIADIAAGANVSERTFFRYFDSKEALLLPDGAELFARIEAELAARPAAEPPLDAVGAALLAAARAFGSSGELALAPAPKGTESLVMARLVQEFVDFEDRLATLVERRLPPGTPEPDLRAAVLAGAALAATRAVLRTHGERRSAGAAASGTGAAGTGASASGAAALLPAALDLLAHLPRIGTIEV
ncbi:TetR/AcrR family transcriptional regulator [Actinacidiphila yanglinensis]|nr:TetR family transcriptional regulator [Actinacidiphila yanglinensis]